ncbi:glycosyltransferase [Pseudanabaena sp. UWO310]|uniref:glycosyltransferase n=1 Tax=Pseudanabaena sp. UWO310 TaxID=2480795 RepID=UPI001156EA92|nr:glycosyltransferase [Pseudanabaena sp. UWO310]TYQ30260.1 glycosyltransferase [Pseudanabaena sp. UWO310]
MPPLVSIIIPCYNNESFVGEAIASVIAQDYNPIEIIVIDDGSSDRSIEIIKGFGDRIYWETGENLGAPKARNRGIELARGEYIKFLDADDVLLPACLSRQVALAEQIDAASKAITYGEAIWVDLHGQTIPSFPLRPRQEDEDAIAHILAHSPLTSCPLHKRQYLLAISGFDPSLPRGQEYDLHLRLVLSGVEFRYDPHPVYKYREYISDRRISQKPYSIKGAMFQFQTLQRHWQLIETQTNKPLQPQVRAILARRFWIFGRSILREGYINEARAYFDAAQSLDSKNFMAGNTIYILLVKVLGFYRTEILITKFKSLLKLIATG